MSLSNKKLIFVSPDSGKEMIENPGFAHHHIRTQQVEKVNNLFTESRVNVYMQVVLMC